MSRTILYYGASVACVSYIEGKDILTHPSAVGRPFPGISIIIRDEEIYADGCWLSAGQADLYLS